jgi:hypothetical protein
MCFRGCTCEPCSEQREIDRRYSTGRSADPLTYRSQQALYRRARRRGLTVEQLQALEIAQGSLCAICGQPETALGAHGKVKSLAVDHDHETGRIRGLLCNNCNRAIGLLGDSVELLLKAVEYLKGSN